MKLLRNLMIALCVVSLLMPHNAEASNGLNEKQNYYANYIAQVAAENWEEYGVLPSVAVAQAFIESSLGMHNPNYNLWGIASGATYYDSLHEGVMGYLKVINNGYYKDAPHQTDYSIQLRKILDGGYCYPEGDYYSNAINSINKYHFDKYDKMMFKNIEKEKIRKRRLLKEKKRIAKQKQKFTVIYDKSVPENTVIVNKKIIKGGTVNIFYENSLQGIYEAKSGAKGRTIRVSDSRLSFLNHKKVYIDVHEEAKG